MDIAMESNLIICSDEEDIESHSIEKTTVLLMSSHGCVKNTNHELQQIDMPSIQNEEEDESDSSYYTAHSDIEFEKNVHKAVEDVRKGGCIVLIARQYGVPKEILYEIIFSGCLPEEREVLTRKEESRLVQWILKMNKKNRLVLKRQLMDKVGSKKKISKLTPIFPNSKFGLRWYIYFLNNHSEIYEDDGLLLTSYEKNEDIVNDEEELLAAYGIKKAVVVLYDCMKLKSWKQTKHMENMFLEDNQERRKVVESNVEYESKRIQIDDDGFHSDWQSTDKESSSEDFDFVVKAKKAKHKKKKKTAD